MSVTEQVPEQVAVDRALARRIMLDGGYGAFTIRSRATGRHVCLSLSAKRRENGRWLSRSTIEGRVGMTDAQVVYVDDPTRGYIGRWVDPGNGQWRWCRQPDADDAAAWAAHALVRWLLVGDNALDAQAEVFAATRCSVCHHALRHPESLIDLTGPDCAGRRREGRRA